jgi:hypothetical protein
MSPFFFPVTSAANFNFVRSFDSLEAGLVESVVRVGLRHIFRRYRLRHPELVVHPRGQVAASRKC